MTDQTHIPGRRQIVEQTPGHWWVVARSGADGSVTPLYEGKGRTPGQRIDDCNRWLKRLP
jgi:hypothetical protein